MGYVNHSLGFAFVHIPKTGGETVADAMYGRRLSLLKGKHSTVRDLNLDDYYIFSIVRNPYDRIASFYRYLKQKRGVVSVGFSDWLSDMHGEPDWLFQPQVRWVDDSVNVFQYEDGVESIIYEVCDIVGITPRPVQEFNKTIHNTALSQDDVELINQIYAEDFEVFGYELR